MLRRFYEFIIRHSKLIIAVFLLLTALGLLMKQLIQVNYDINDYLPDDAPSTQAITTMENEFSEGIPNARVLIKDVSIPKALEYKEQLSRIDGVENVTWLDDSVDITVPLKMSDQRTVENYYKDNNALFSLTVEEEKDVEVVEEIRNLVGEENAVSGGIVNMADARTKTLSEVSIIVVAAVVFVFLILLISTNSWIEPLVVLAGLGIAIAINSGTDLIFGEVSFVTNAAGNVLQLAVSLDYSVFLIHRFEEELKKEKNPKKAMVNALTKSTSSIASSGLTTVIGFLAMVMMRFKIGPDLGLSLAKGVAISLITTFIFMPAFILAMHKLMQKTRHRSFVPSFKKFGKTVSRITVPLCAAFIIILLPAFLASHANSYYYGSSKLFTEESRIGRDAKITEDIFGQNDTYALLVKSGDRSKEKALSDELHELPEVTNILSYVDNVGNTIPNSYLDEKTYQKLNSDNYSRMVLSVDVPYEGEEAFSLVKKIREIGEKYYPGEYRLAGNGVSTYDLKETVTSDMVKVNILSIGAIFIVLAISLKSLLVPIILILAIESAIFINLAIPYFSGEVIFYIAYLIISSVQLGATVDYAILSTDRYKENRLTLDRRKAIAKTVSDVTSSILVSGSVLTIVGFLMGIVSSNQLLSQLGTLIGRGGLLSLLVVIFILPGLLYLFDKIIIKGEKNEKNA
ncbi:MMPL family transporter [Candidatus Saccharibacteria bacterium]|nr:MMPL family transporter [Candidatus Saccharibacteria bacterium]